MGDDPLIDRTRRVWVELADVPVAFPEGGGAEVVVASDGSLLCPPGWVGIVAIGDAAIATVPVDGLAGPVRTVLGGVPVPALTDPGRFHAALPVLGLLGPATLAYLDESEFRPAGSAAVERLTVEHADLAALLASVSEDDEQECGLRGITSPAFVVRDAARVVAAAGYQRWPGGMAHLCVLTASDLRGRGLARAVASAAVADALGTGLLPQWRARPEPSRRVARALGFRQLGNQMSVLVDH
jgi:GNAT superfamily N-acetyltransferase